MAVEHIPFQNICSFCCCWCRRRRWCCGWCCRCCRGCLRATAVCCIHLSSIHHLQAKLPSSFSPSDELAAEGQRLRTATSNPADGHRQTHTARDGLSEGERKVHALLVRDNDVKIYTSYKTYENIKVCLVRRAQETKKVDGIAYLFWLSF